MARVMFNSALGIVGFKGQLAKCVYFRNSQGQIERYSGAFSKTDTRGTSNVLCSLNTKQHTMDIFNKSLWTLAKLLQYNIFKSRNVSDFWQLYIAQPLLKVNLNGHKKRFGKSAKYYTLYGLTFALGFKAFRDYIIEKQLTTESQFWQQVEIDRVTWDAQHPGEEARNNDTMIIVIALLWLEKHSKDLIGIDLITQL